MQSPAIGLTLKLHGPPAVQLAEGHEIGLESRRRNSSGELGSGPQSSGSGALAPTRVTLP